MQKPNLALIIDDDQDDLDFFVDALGHADASIKAATAKSGEEALKLLTQKQALLPDIIFLDLNMPRLGGLQLLKLLKTNDGTAAIPVIICTTSNYPGDREEAEKLGALYYIVKPNKFEMLAKEIERVFEMLGKKSVAK